MYLLPLALVLALSTHLWAVAPTAALDDSWRLAMHLWAHGDAQGQPVDFTYGPLGFLSIPVNWVRLTTTVSVVFTLVVQVLLALVLLKNLALRDRLLVGLVPAWLVMVFSSGEGTIEALECLSFAWAALLWTRPGRAPALRLPLLGGGYVGLLVLIKPGSALVAAGALGVCVLALCEPGWRRKLAPATGFAVTAAATVLIGWVLVGQPIRGLLPWLKASAAFANGYGAMAFEEPGRAWEYPWAIGGVVAVAILWWSAQEVRRGWAVSLVLVFLYLQFKHGFVRHDGHSVGFFLSVLIALLLVPRGDVLPTRARSVGQLVTAQLAVLGLLLAARVPLSMLPLPTASLRSAQDEISTLSSGGAWDTAKRQQQQLMTSSYRLSGAVRGALSGGLQVDPWDVGVVYAYDVAWHPVPVFQEYSAFTPWLDHQNAAALSGPHPPQRVLRSKTYGTIDDRFAMFDSPGYQLALACRYREVAADKAWQVLAVGPDRCGPERLVSDVALHGGEAVTIPTPADPDSAVVARVVLGRSWLDEVAGVILKPVHTPRVCLDDACYRLVQATASGPLVLRKAAWMPAGPVGSDTVFRTVRFEHVPAGSRIQFYEVPRT